jgi:hypothetical protein
LKKAISKGMTRNNLYLFNISLYQKEFMKLSSNNILSVYVIPALVGFAWYYLGLPMEILAATCVVLLIAAIYEASGDD